MTRQELKQWAKNKISGNLWKPLLAIIITVVLTGISIPFGTYQTEYNGSMINTTRYINIGWILYFVQVGFVYFMIKFITDRNPDYGDLFKYAKDFGRCLAVNIVQTIIITLFTFLLIVPGVIKAYAYALVPYLLQDEKYKDLSISELLKLSEEMMNGHKSDAFVLALSFFGWFLLIVPTFGLIFIYLGPYMYTTITKFYYDIKEKYEKENGTLSDTINDKAKEVKEAIEDKIDEKKDGISKKVKETEEEAKEKVEEAADKVIEKVEDM